MVQILLLRFRCSVFNKMTRLWLASATLLCFAVTVLKCEELNSYESGMCNKLLINREYNSYFKCVSRGHAGRNPLSPGPK